MKEIKMPKYLSFLPLTILWVAWTLFSFSKRHAYHYEESKHWDFWTFIHIIVLILGAFILPAIIYLS